MENGLVLKPWRRLRPADRPDMVPRQDASDLRHFRYVGRLREDDEGIPGKQPVRQTAAMSASSDLRRLKVGDLLEDAHRRGRELSVSVDKSTGAAWYELKGESDVIEFYKLSELVKWLGVRRDDQERPAAEGPDEPRRSWTKQSVMDAAERQREFSRGEPPDWRPVDRSRLHRDRPDLSGGRRRSRPDRPPAHAGRLTNK